MIEQERAHRLATRLIENIRVKRIPVLRGRYVLRHKGKRLRRHRFNEMFDSLQVLTQDQAIQRMIDLDNEIDAAIDKEIRHGVVPNPIESGR